MQGCIVLYILSSVGGGVRLLGEMAGVLVSGFAGGFATVLEGAEVTEDFAENLRHYFTADYAW